MYTVEDIRKEYDRLDTLLNVDTSNINISISGRLSKKLGYFQVKSERMHFGKPVNPTLSIAIAKGICNDEKLFYDTIRHEYAHALVFLRTGVISHNHDEVWKLACRQVGCEPKATTVIKSDAIAKNLYKYSLSCDNCGATAYYKRDCPTLLIARGEYKGPKIHCRKCGGKKFTVKEL